MTDVFVLEFVDANESTFEILLIEVVRDLDETIGCTWHSRKYNKVLLTIGDEFDYIFHTLWRTYWGATKFHYFHIFDHFVLDRLRLRDRAEPWEIHCPSMSEANDHSESEANGLTVKRSLSDRVAVYDL